MYWYVAVFLDAGRFKKGNRPAMAQMHHHSVHMVVHGAAGGVHGLMRQFHGDAKGLNTKVLLEFARHSKVNWIKTRGH